MTTTATCDRRTKITLRIPRRLHDTALEAVRLGLAPTQNAFIEDAIRMREREVYLARMRVRAREAMNDPAFVHTMRSAMQDFAHIDAENWPVYDGNAPEVAHE